MVVKLRNYAIAAITVGACLMGLIGPLVYPELMVEAQMASGMHYIPMI